MRRVTLDWAASPCGETATHFVIYRGEEKIAELSGDTTQYVDEVQEDRGVLEYKVYAGNSRGLSEPTIINVDEFVVGYSGNNWSFTHEDVEYSGIFLFGEYGSGGPIGPTGLQASYTPEFDYDGLDPDAVV